MKARVWSVALAAALLGVVLVAGSTQHGAAAAPAPTFRVFSNYAIHADGHGDAMLPVGSGTDNGISGILCTGAQPRGGGGIPGQVVTELRHDRTYLRILHTNGAPLSGDVKINCVYEKSGAVIVR